MQILTYIRNGVTQFAINVEQIAFYRPSHITKEVEIYFKNVSESPLMMIGVSVDELTRVLYTDTSGPLVINIPK